MSGVAGASKAGKMGGGDVCEGDSVGGEAVLVGGEGGSVNGDGLDGDGERTRSAAAVG